MVRPVKERKDISNSVHECVGYIRVSTKSQAETGVSLDAQRKMILDYCKDQNNNCHLDPERIYTDEGKSAFKHHNKRTGYQNAKTDIEKGRADTLIIYSLSRAFRSVRECIDTMALLQDCDANIISITESNINTTSKAGRFVYYLFGALAQFESEQISERVRDTMLNSFERTGFLGSRKPTGYQFVKDWIPEKKRGVVTKVHKGIPPYYEKEKNGEREIVDKVFELYKKGSGQRIITRETGLNLSVVGWMISNPLYSGYLLWSTKDGDYRIKKGEHESYITREEFNRNVTRRIKACKNNYHNKRPPFKILLNDNKEPYLKFIEIKEIQKLRNRKRKRYPNYIQRKDSL